MRLAAGRWRPFLEQLHRYVPEVAEFVSPDDAVDCMDEWTPGRMYASLSQPFMRAAMDGNQEWLRRLLAFVEVTAAAYELLPEEDDNDLLELGTFCGAGFLCDLTADRSALTQALPLLGPRSVKSAQAGVVIHSRVIEYWGGRDIDWTSATSQYVPLKLDPLEVLPIDRRTSAHTKLPHDGESLAP